MQQNFSSKSQNTEIKLFQEIEPEFNISQQKNNELDCFFSSQQKTEVIEPCGNQYQQSIDEQPIQEQEIPIQQTSEKKKPKRKLRPTITADTRLSNYVFPNIVREVKHCLFNSFQAENKHLYNSLLQFFKDKQINYQVWAFDAILVCLIFLRDKTQLLAKKKYFAIIDLISSTLSKFLDKFLTKPFTSDQREYFRNQYNFCLLHLKVYDDANNTFDSLSGLNGEIIRREFFECVLLNRRRLRFKFVEFIKEIQKTLSSNFFPMIVNDKYTPMKGMENNGSNE